MSQESKIFKITLVGIDLVGKTSIISRIRDNTFDEDYNSTIIARHFSKSFSLDNGTKFIFDIWDSGGKEKCRPFLKNVIKDSNVVILVYDITQKESLDVIKNFYFPIIQEKCDKDIIIAMAANKYDLAGRNIVDEEAALEFAEKINAIFCHISAKDNL